MHSQVIRSLDNLYDDQLLQPLPDQIHTLVNLQSDGSGWTPGQRTAFEDLFRLLEVADQPLSCALVINEDSLAIYILETIAGFDASTIELAVSLSQGMVDFLLTLGDLGDGEPMASIDGARDLDDAAPGELDVLAALQL